MSKIIPGKCSACDQVTIWYKDPKLNMIVYTREYAEFAMMLSNNTLTGHSICSRCIVALTDQKVSQIFERIRETWADDYVGWATERQFANLKALTVVSWDNGLNMDKEAEKKYKTIKDVEHKEKIKAKEK